MVLTVQDLLYELEASGLSVPALDGLDPHDYKAVIDKQIRAVTGAVGRAHGLEYAEGFRRSRFGTVARLAKDQELEEDV